MPLPRIRKHIVVVGRTKAEPYQRPPRKIDEKALPAPSDPVAHAKRLATALTMAAETARARREAATVKVDGAHPGQYLELESPPGIPLDLGTLAQAKRGMAVVAVTQAPGAADDAAIERATVFVPDKALAHFSKRFESYATQTTAGGERPHSEMINRIADLRLAALRGLWTDAPEAYPAENEAIWWEVWLRRHDGEELTRFLRFAELVQIDVGPRRLALDDRIVMLAKATPAQLARALDVLSDLAELRRAKETAETIAAMDAEEQGDWVRELLSRVVPPAADAPAVCVLDTGVTRGHPLLAEALHPDDTHTCDPRWGSHDHHGHGTEMAGLALYGNLVPLLASSLPVTLGHRLESVKILPPDSMPPNVPELYGTVTAEAASRVEIQAPHRRRCFSMAITAKDQRDRGQPTSWSAAIDALAVGRSFDPATQGLVYTDDAADEAAPRRLFLVCAGNVEPPDPDHLSLCDTEPVQDPGQAWNALTVGAHTELATLPDDDEQGLAGWTPIAATGELSPWSSTSVMFADRWPIKPDVVFEGGNALCNADGEVDEPCPALCVVTTNARPMEKALALSWATSAATAQVARIAAAISADYPELWPETVRALIVHSAEWTAVMRKWIEGAKGKRARAALIRRYGFGVPSSERALRSANNALTLIAQETIRPFEDGKMNQMHVHALPWPSEALEALGEVNVRLRVTLSYFVEPNPARRGWRDRYQYASHGLRFDLKSSLETVEAFRKRINAKAREQGEKAMKTDSDSKSWVLGEQARFRGSLHSDIWTGPAAVLAQRGVVGISPVSGWWKTQKERDRSARGARYALVLSIEADATDVDIWTPVAQEVGLEIEEVVDVPT